MERYPKLANNTEEILAAFFILKECFSGGHKLLVAGNGGSAADSEHIVGELMKGFTKRRKISDDMAEKLVQINPIIGEEIAKNLQGALPAIALTGHNSLSTAFSNDVDARDMFSQQVFGYGKEGDVFLGITTSGNSKNVIRAAITAKAMGMKVLGLTGKTGGDLAKIADITIKAPETETFMVQEFHLPIYHTLCLMIEDEFFGE